MRLVAGSDARVVSPLFTDLDEAPCATTGVPTVAVTSVLNGALSAPTATAWTGHTGRYRATLTAATHLAAVDQLTVTWTGTADGAARTLTQQVDVAGGVYVQTDVLAAQRTVPETDLGMEALRAWRTSFELIAERARGVAYVPRLAIEDHPASHRCSVPLEWARPRELLAVWVDGEAVDVDLYELDKGSKTVSGDFSYPVRLAYSHGYTQPPEALVAACQDYVRAKALSTTSDQARTVLSFTNLASGEVYRYGTADWDAGRWTGMESVDSLISSVDDERRWGVK